MELNSGDAVWNVDSLQGLIGCVFAIAAIWYAYRGGAVRYGTIPMPREGRIVIFVCAIIIFVISVRRLMTGFPR